MREKALETLAIAANGAKKLGISRIAFIISAWKIYRLV